MCQEQLWTEKSVLVVRLALTPLGPLTRALQGGLFSPPPPVVFRRSQENGGAQRRQILHTCFPIFCAPWVKILTPGDLWSGHQVRSSDPTSERKFRSLQSHQAHSCWDRILKPAGSSKGIRSYNLHISKFLYRWPKVRSFLRPAHYKSMGEISTYSECHPMTSICSGS